MRGDSGVKLLIVWASDWALGKPRGEKSVCLGCEGWHVRVLQGEAWESEKDLSMEAGYGGMLRCHCIVT